MTKIKNFTELIAQLRPYRQIADELGYLTGRSIKLHSIAMWSERNSIPAKYYEHILVLCKKNKIPITASDLLKFAANAKK
jgi:hypothetical protein